MRIRRMCSVWGMGSLIVIGLLVSSTTGLLSAPPVEPQPSSGQDAAAAGPAGEVLVKSSRVFVFVGKTGFGHEHGIEGRIKSGRVRLGASQDAGQIVFDMGTFNADTAAARRYVGLSGTTDDSTRNQVNTNMLGPEVLSVRRFPTATFRINSAARDKQNSRAGHPQYSLSGTFTLHGTSRPLRLRAEAIASKNGTTRLRGAFVIRQTDFGITPYSKAFGAVGVTNELKIFGEIDLRSAEATASR